MLVEGVGGTHTVKSVIVYCVLRVNNDQHGQLLVGSFQVIDQGEQVLFELFWAVVLMRVCGCFRWRVC